MTTLRKIENFDVVASDADLAAVPPQINLAANSQSVFTGLDSAGNFWINGAMVSGGGGAASILTNAQTGTSYTIVDGDRGKIVTFSNVNPVAVTLPQAGAAGQFVAGWYCWLKNTNVGYVTVTITTSTLSGAASIVMPPGAGILLVSDGTNYTAPETLPGTDNKAFCFSQSHSGSYSAAAGWTANRVWVMPMELESARIITKPGFYLTTAVASSHGGVAVYDAAGNRLLTTGALDTSVTAPTIRNATITPILLMEGLYYASFTTDSNTVGIEFFQGNGNIGLILAASGVRQAPGFSVTTSAGGVPPAAINVSSGFTASASPPLVFLE